MGNMVRDGKRAHRQWFGSHAGSKGRLNSSGHSCVCRSCADVSVCCSSTCHVAGLLIPWVSRSLLANLVPDMLPPWLLVNFCSYSHLFGLESWLAMCSPFWQPYISSPFFWLPEYLIPCLPWPQMTISWSVFCLPGSWHHPGTLPFSCPSCPPHYLIKLGSEDGVHGY